MNLATGAAPGASGVSDVVAVVGGAGANTLIGPDADTNWNVTATDAGSVAGVSFSGVENLAGGSGADVFVFTGGSVAAAAGGAGSDTLDLSADTVGVVVDIAAGTASHAGAVSGIENVVTGSGEDTLIGPAGDTTWNVSGPGSGEVAGIAFRGLENLTGAVGNQDRFVFADGGGLSGVLEGGDGGFDTVVLDAAYDAVAYAVTGPDSGILELDGVPLVFAGMEPILLTQMAGVIRHLGTSGNDVITVRDVTDQPIDGPGGSGPIVQMEIDLGGGGETLQFANPSSALIIAASEGDDGITIESVDPSFSAELILEFGNDWGNDTLVDSVGGHRLDFTSFDGALTVTAPDAATRQIEGVRPGETNTLQYDVAANFDTGLDVSAAVLDALGQGLVGLATLGGEFEEAGRLAEPIFLLDGLSIGEFSDLEGVLTGLLVDPLTGQVDLTLDELLDLLNQSTGLAAVGTLSANGVLTLDLQIDGNAVAPTTNSVALDLGPEVGQRLVAAEGETGVLETRLDWAFTVGVDPTGSPVAPSFSASSGSALTVFADLDLLPASASPFDARAGLLGLRAEDWSADWTGSGSGQSSIDLDAEVQIGAVDLDGALAGSTTPASLAQTGSANVDIDLFLRPLGGVLGVPDAFLRVDGDTFATGTPLSIADDFDAQGISNFLLSEASAVLQVMQQFGDYLDVLSLKSLDNETILLAAGTTLGELITLAGADGLPDLVGADGLFREGFLELIELPPHTSVFPVDRHRRSTGGWGDPGAVAGHQRNRRSGVHGHAARRQGIRCQPRWHSV